MPQNAPAFRAFAALVARVTAPLRPSEAAMARIAGAADARTLVKGDHLLHAGDVAGHLFFVHEGLLRYYYADPGTGEERTGQFFAEGGVITDVASFLDGTPAVQSIQALEAGTVLRVPRAALYAAYDADHAVERFGRLMIERALVGSQRRSASLLSMSPTERYRAFVADRAELARRVPQYLVASYLGITPEALSRIRGRLAKPAAR